MEKGVVKVPPEGEEKSPEKGRSSILLVQREKPLLLWRRGVKVLSSGREPGWGRHAEDRNKIIPTAKVLYVIHPSFRIGYKIGEIEREKIYRLMT